MEKVIDPGFFAQEHVDHLVKVKCINEAKAYTTDIIDEYVEMHPKVKAENVKKARGIIEKARSPIALATSVQNFILSHPSEGLGVLK